MIQVIKDTWVCLPEFWRWLVGILLIPVVVCALPLLLVGVVVALMASGVVDMLDDWSSK